MNFETEAPVFLRGMGTTNAEVHYELSDACTWKTLFNESLNETDPKVEQITEVISAFEEAADEFLVGFLESSGWRVVSA